MPATNWFFQLQLLAGTLIVAFSIITKVYGGVLTAVVTIPISQPLINSIFDIRNKPDIRVNVDRNLAVDIVIHVNIFWQLTNNFLLWWPSIDLFLKI